MWSIGWEGRSIRLAYVKYGTFDGYVVRSFANLYYNRFLCHPIIYMCTINLVASACFLEATLRCIVNHGTYAWSDKKQEVTLVDICAHPMLWPFFLLCRIFSTRQRGYSRSVAMSTTCYTDMSRCKTVYSEAALSSLEIVMHEYCCNTSPHQVHDN